MGRAAVPLNFVFTVFLSLFWMEGLRAQFSQLPVAHYSPQTATANENLRTKAEPLSLPFWDDFSSGQIDSLKWHATGTVTSQTIGIDPPSVGVVYFDGVDERGKPYSTAMLENGEADQLTSQEIDLSSYRAADSLYLSFFWQAGGKGEMPDENDQLELYFLDDTGEWIRVWGAPGGDIQKRETFSQEMVKVNTPFYHGQFRFRFLNKGRLSGPFDSWVLDYIYLNKGRSVFDVHYEDRALTKTPTSPLGKYTALPIWEWENNKNSLLGTINSQFKNLSGRFRAMEYTILFRDKSTHKVLQQLHSQTPFNPVPQALERRDFSSVALKELDFEVSEEFDLETVVYLTTGDRLLVEEISERDTVYSSKVDYRANDTVYHTLPIRDFMAYDNGSVDYAAGINQRSGMLALKYDVSARAYLKGISINFANLSQVGSALELMVWRDLNAEPVYREEVLIPTKEQLDDFAYFALDTNLSVIDTIYVGFTQFSNDFIYVGLDKSNDTGQDVFFNVTGSWEQNQEVRGSLMMRPHFSLEPPKEVTEESGSAGIIAYPNPVIERLFIEGATGEVKIFDAYGRQINVPVESFERGKILNFAGSEKGVYVIRAWTNNQPNSIRILVK
jgi:hypothetical protein